jgi:hypothetical protein
MLTGSVFGPEAMEDFIADLVGLGLAGGAEFRFAVHRVEGCNHSSYGRVVDTDHTCGGVEFGMQLSALIVKHLLITNQIGYAKVALKPCTH